ncbi:hypothetical protein ACTJKN_02135 [Pedobacter sp. 22163]|uniref:hypothetical protein n=1 Tax=Pedobacter sp. 22163 TaxID=3453883 RepID=UPI003F85EB6F
MINYEKEDLSEDPDDELMAMEDPFNVAVPMSPEMEVEHDSDLLEQADKSSEASFELDTEK